GMIDREVAIIARLEFAIGRYNPLNIPSR
ncbi:MAG: hypothetical protein QG641_641, partial [Candidatus Poribacteria bacterium]|nr:hypothetical protein [Candidatus Poribacteria bacterium]